MTGAFWKATGERAAKTFAQSLLATLTLASPVVDVLHTNWLGAVSVAAGATFLSLLTSLAGLGDDTPGKHAAAVE